MSVHGCRGHGALASGLFGALMCTRVKGDEEEERKRMLVYLQWLAEQRREREKQARETRWLRGWKQ